MGLFNFGKPKPMSEKKRAKLINKIRKNKTAINKLEAEAQMAPLTKGKTKKYLKLKEENIKMAKLVLKDGKLQKVDEGQQQAPQVPQPPMPPQQEPSQPQGMPQAPLPPSFPQQQTEANTMVGEPQLNAQMREAPPQAPPQAPQPDQYVQMMQQQEAQQRAQQEAMLRQRQEAMARAQAAQQAPAPAPRPAPMPGQIPGQIEVVTVALYLIGDKKISGEIPAQEVMAFVEDVKVAINTKSTFQFGDRFINGEHIVFYEVGDHQ